uniref:Uncharacterized protein n=1 Tax=Oryza brachyantha TaxID=4533 RepID=J3MS50_ORYBR
MATSSGWSIASRPSARGTPLSAFTAPTPSSSTSRRSPRPSSRTLTTPRLPLSPLSLDLTRRTLPPIQIHEARSPASTPTSRWPERGSRRTHSSTGRAS